MKNMKMFDSTKVRWGFCFGLAASLWNGSPTLAASLTVTNTDDSGPGSLRQAILTATPGDTINFAIRGEIALTTGELLLTNNLSIAGPGATNLTVSGRTS